MRLKVAIPKKIRLTRFPCGLCVAFCAGMLLAAAPGRAQDVAEAARQEKARKAKEQKPAPHVYTEEDLKRERILTPSDRARAEARKKNSPAPGTRQQPALDAEKNSESLGEIARRYRREKAAHEAEEALKKPPASGFPMKLPAESLAAPKKALAPLREGRAPVVRKNPGVAPKLSQPNFSVPPVASAIAPGAHATPKRTIAPRRISPSLPPVAAIHGKIRAVIVKNGDSWWKLSREYLGRGSRWQELFALNPGQPDPNFLATGREILVPALGSPAARASSVTVQRGDTLWAIARAHFGLGAAWTCVAQANPQVSDANLILPGQVIRLPESCGSKP